MKIIAIIPAKMAAKRFPGKPLVQIAGVPMVSHIYERAKLARGLDGLFVASHDTEIKEQIEAFGGEAVMENNTEKNAVAGMVSALPEIISKLGYKPDRVIMIQGDEPMIYPELIEEMATFMRKNSEMNVVNVSDKIRSTAEYSDPNIVKVIKNVKGEGIWFFRVPSPRWNDHLDSLPIAKQTGIIGFSYEYLTNPFPGRTPLEAVESVDMFRLIEHGMAIPLIESVQPLYSVDTENDRNFVEKLIEKDPLIHTYAAKYRR